MRQFFVLVLLIPHLLFSQAKSATELLAQDLKKYAMKSGEITYDITGDAEGEEKMNFDSYGWKSMRKQNMIFELYGIKTVQTLYEISDGDFIYRLNEGDSTMVVRKDIKWSQQASYKNPLEVSESILFSMGGNRSTMDSALLDKTCQVWTFDNKAIKELWIWNGLVMKRKTKLGDKMVISTANSIEIGIETEETIFEIPDYMKEKE